MKVLLITHNAFHKSRNNGKTLEALFSRFRKEDLAQLFFSQNEEPDWDYCDNYYQLTDSEVLKHIWGIDNDCCLKQNEEVYINNARRSKNRLFKILKKAFTNKPFIRNLVWKHWHSKHLFGWIENFNPDVIFFLAGNLAFSFDIVNELSRKYSLPIVLYFTDDYSIYPIYKNLCGNLWRRKIYNKTKNIVSNASLCLSIGSLMSDIYGKEFNKQFYPVMNSVNIPNNLIRRGNKGNNKLSISYIGSLHLGREESLVEFSILLSEVMKELNLDYILNVYTTSRISENNKAILEKNRMLYKGAVYGEDLENALFNSDILLHVESTNKYHYSFAKLSVSTKIPEYLSTAKFVLGFGPSSLASFRLLSDNSIGGVIPCEHSKKDQMKLLKLYMEDKKLRDAYSLRAYSYCRENFDINVVGEKMYNYISNLTSI